ncbi:MAG: HlyC/CorC family transporter [Pyrinomonadaceae bacterium]|nr:HlyC/CorC family transporter [Pyrinomonadaceae bacterium]
MQLEIIAGLLLLVLMTFLATVDMAFSHISDVGLRRISSDEELADKKRAVSFLREILDNRPRFRFALSATIQVLLIGFTVLVTLVLAERMTAKWERLAAAFGITLVATVLLRQIVPRLLVIKNPERKLVFLLPAIRPLYWLVSLFVDPVVSRRERTRQKIEATIAPDGADEADDDNDDDFQALMEVGEAEGIIEEDERELIETVVEFGDTLTSEIMTPRTEIAAVRAGTLIKDARDLMIEEKYSRLPIYRDSIDNIVGMVYVRDLLSALATGRKEEPVENIKREAFFVPETKTAAELLKSMQQNHVQIAVVIDEYGGVAGLVTVEDILEEIVGEIEDEDITKDEIVELTLSEDGSCDVPGSTEIDEIEDLFDIELEDEDYTTIAGLVVTEAGYVPRPGEKLELKGLSVEVLAADEKRITRLRLMPVSEQVADVDD